MVPHSGFDGRDSPWFQTVYWLFIVKNGCISTSQGEPGIKYLLQAGMSEKRSLLAKPLGPIGTSLAGIAFTSQSETVSTKQ